MTDRSQIIQDIGADSSKLNPFEGLESQIKNEYDLGWKHQKPKKDEWEVRLKLYNNQKRDKKAVGDTTMFSIFQTILASLYDDRLEVAFSGKEQGDEEVADNLNALAQSDYPDMQKDETDFDWDWDTAFFGRGLCELQEYERNPSQNIFLPIPRILDPITFIRDPYAVAINGKGIRHWGATRFNGYEAKFTKSELQDNPHIFDDIKFEEIKYDSGSMSILEDAIRARDDAQGNQNNLKNEAVLGANSQYTITIWNTHFDVNGTIKKVRVWLANDRAKVIGLEVLKTDYWPIIDRPLFPHSHDWDGTSIPDLTEDKQRARAVAQNLGLNAMKADLYPMYIYDSNKITNRNDLNFAFNKFIPIDGKNENITNAIAPLIKARPNMNLLDFIYTSLDASAQKATATPDTQQGAQSSKERTLGELNLISSKVDTRYSLSAKVFGWSEKVFWKYWYNLHKDNFADHIDEKVLRVVGAFGPKWRPLGKVDITTKNFDPDIAIESTIVNRAKQQEERQLLSGYISLIIQDPTINRRYALKELGKVSGLKKDKLDRLFPPTIDEMEAEVENEALNVNKPASVLREQNHIQHLEVHSRANLTNATKAHLATHHQALMIKRTNPQMFPEQAATDAQNQMATGMKPPENTVPTSPDGQARPGNIPAAFGGQ